MPSGAVKFLLVDDLEENLLSLRALLARDGLELLQARSAREALELLLVHDVGLAIVDVQMPDMDGFELAELMRGTERTRRVPIIFLTAGAIDRQRRFRGYEAGAVDFLFKPVEPHVLRSKAEVFFELYRQRQEIARQRDELRAAAQVNDGLLQDARRTAEALTAAKEQAEAANSAKDRFLAVLSHELRTPLSPVLMTVSTLETDAALPADLRNAMAMIRRNIEVEASLIDDLLDLSRVLNGKLRLTVRPVHLHQVVQHAIDTCAAEAADKRLAIRTAFAAPADQVTGDPARLQQVFWNLLKNAIKFTPQGGQICIESAAADRLVHLSVTDTGIGIPPAALGHIFDAFEQADGEITRTYGGLGLGLAICKSIVELHGGRIAAHSDGRGHGARFDVALPLATPRGAGPPAPAAPAAPAAAPAAGRLLLVEDHADTARVLSRTLRLQGYDVTVAASVQAALELAAAGQFDLLVSDLGLPDASGYELMREVRRRFGIHGIAMSGYGMEDDVRKSHEAGFSEHLVKPVNLLELDDAIRRTLRHPHADPPGP
jgi:signal transduction histidine kinase